MADADVAAAPNDADTPDEAQITVPEPERLHGALVVRVGDDVVLHTDRGALVDLVTKLRADGYWQCIDLFGVDFLTHPGRSTLPADVEAERFELVVLLLNHNDRTRVRIRVQVPESDAVVPTLFKLHPGTEAMEREAYDMFGIVFEGHPDMTRILMPDEWSGHPLRKDYAVGRIPVQFKHDGLGRSASGSPSASSAALLGKHDGLGRSASGSPSASSAALLGKHDGSQQGSRS